MVKESNVIVRAKKKLRLYFFRYRHILIYIVIGLFSILIELFIRNQLVSFEPIQ